MCKSCYSHPKNPVNIICIYQLQNQITFSLAFSKTGRSTEVLKETLFVVHSRVISGLQVQVGIKRLSQPTVYFVLRQYVILRIHCR